MPKLTTKNGNAARLELRISQELYSRIRDYSELHLENISEVIVNAVKQTIGFQNIAEPKKLVASAKVDTGSAIKLSRLSLRIHSNLKDALNCYTEIQGCTLSQAVIFSVQNYLKIYNKNKGK